MWIFCSQTICQKSATVFNKGACVATYLWEEEERGEEGGRKGKERKGREMRRVIDE